MPVDPWAEFQMVQTPGVTPPQPVAPPSADPWAEFQTVQETAPAPAPAAPNYEEGFLQELEQLRAHARRQGLPDVPIGAQQVLLDQHRVAAGLPPLMPQAGQFYGPEAEANRGRKQSTFADIRNAPANVLAQLPGNLVRSVAPETGNEMLRNVEQTYGQAQTETARNIGDVAGGIGTAVATLPTGPIGMGVIYGAAGAGQVRGDIAERRAAGEDISAGQEAAAAGLTGAIEGVSGFVGGKIFGKIGDKLTRFPGLKQIIAKEGTRGVIAIIKRIAPEMVAEGGEEALTQFADNFVKQQIYAPEQKLGEGVVRSGVIGAGISPIVGGVGGHLAKSGGQPQMTPEQSRAKAQEIADANVGGTTTATINGETATSEKPAAKPDRVSKTDIIDSIPNDQADKFAISNAIENEPGEFVRINVTPDDFDQIPIENLSKEKVESLAKLSPEEVDKLLPPVIAVAGEGGKLRIKDGRHRLLAAAARARAAGQPPGAATFSAVVPESWVSARQGAGEVAKSPEMKKAGRGQPNETVRSQAADYLKASGVKAEPDVTDYVPVNPETGKKIADAYEAAKHEPNNPEVKRAYDAFKQETKAQWDYLNKQGVKFEPWKGEGQPYANSEEMRADVAKGHLFFFQGGDIPADHPLSEKFNDQLTYNDVFRAVHDYFGHSKEGYGFGARGEENAWRAHSAMFGPEARRAMTTETRGQNSWVNFGPKGEANRANPAKTQYAEQKATLLPAEFSVGGGGKPPVPPAGTDEEGLPGDAGESNQPAGPGPGRRLFRAAANVFRDPTKGPLADLEKRIMQAKGKTSLTAMDADRVGKAFNQAAKDSAIDPNSADAHQIIEALLRGKGKPEGTSSDIAGWAAGARVQLDKESKNLAKKLREAGLPAQAKAVEDNLGTYLKNVPKETVSPTGRMKDWAKRKLALSPSFGKVKQDKFIVWDGKKPLKKFDTQEEANAFLDDQIKVRKEGLIKKAATERTPPVTEADLKRKAAKGLRLTEPISEEWRAEHEIHDPRYLVARSMIETRHNSEMIDLFQFAAQRYGEQAPEDMSGEDIEAWAEENGLEPLPESGRLHALKGVYVPKAVADRLKEHVRLPSEVERIYRAALSAWKASKTVYNPGTHVRNWLTNALVFSDLADTSPANPKNWPSYKKAVESMSKRDEVFRRAVEKGLIGNEYSSTELKAIQEAFRTNENVLDALFTAAGKAHRQVLKSYDVGDIIFKLATVHNNMRKGMSVDKAIADADEWYPNYARVAKITRFLRNTPVGAPFVSFFDQSARIAGRAVRRKPLKVAKIVAMPLMLDALARAMAGIRDEEDKLITQDNAVSEFARRLTSPMVPIRDKDGRVMTLDLRSILPLANDLMPQARNGSTIIPWIFSGPLSNTVIEQLSGKERFTGRNFIREDMTTGEALRARGSRALDTLAPVPTALTYGRERVQRAAEGQSEESLGRAVLGALGGVNIRTPYIAERIVKKVIQNMIGDREREGARSVLKEWNETYKPGDQPNLKMDSLVRGMRVSMKRSKHEARDKAAEAILAGDEAEAKRIIEEFNSERPERLTELRFEDAKRQSETFHRRGKER